MRHWSGRNTEKLNETTHSSAVHSIINPTKFDDDLVYHKLDRGFICHIHVDNETLILGVGGVLLALLSCILSALLIQIDKCHALDACLSKGKCCLFSNAGCCLHILSAPRGGGNEDTRQGLHTPVTLNQGKSAVELHLSGHFGKWQCKLLKTEFLFVCVLAVESGG